MARSTRIVRHSGAPAQRARRCALIAAALVLLALSAGTGTARLAHAAITPPLQPTATPVPTQTPYPTYTAVPSATLLPTATPAHHPALSVSPTQAMPGARIIVAATDFPANGAVTLTWDGNKLASGTADDTGYVAVNATVPTSKIGPHEIHAVGPNRTSATALFTVAQVYHPALTVSVAQALAGAQVLLNASGFAPGQTVTFFWDSAKPSARLGDAPANDSGDAQLDITIGQGFAAVAGPHRLYATGADPALSTSAFLTVQPTPPHCGGLVIPLPFVDPLCIDPVGWLTASLSGAATAAADSIGGQVAPALIDQPDYFANDQLRAPFTVLQGLGRDLFGILFLAGVLSWSVRRLGLGSPGDAGAQIMEGAVGLGLMQALPWLIPSYITAVNGLSGAILDDPGNKAGGAIIASLVRDLVTTGLFSGLAGLPLVLVVITGAILVFLVLLLLIIITRDIGITYGAAVFVAAPLCIVCGVTPLTRGVAFAWARLWFSLTLWGVWYALALVVVRAELATFATGGGLASLAGALAGILVVYGAPKLGDALIGGGATRALGIGHVPLLATAIGTATGMATGNGITAATAAMKAAAAGAGGGGAGGGEAAAPAMPTVTELGGSAGPALAGGDAIEGTWGLLESAGV